MGQSLSGDSSSNTQTRTITLDECELNNLFIKKCLAQLKQIETFSIKSNLKINDLNQDTVINKEEFIGLLNLGDKMDNDLVTLLFDLLLSLAEFPLLSSKTTGTINVVKLLKLINLISLRRFNQIFNKEMDYAELIVTALALSNGIEEETILNDDEEADKLQENAKQLHQGINKTVEATIINNKLSWSSINYYQGFNKEGLKCSVKELSLLFSFCLSIFPICIDENNFLSICQFEDNFEPKNWKSYEKVSLSMIRTINYNVKSINSEEQLKLSDIIHAIKTTFPNILSPLSHILNNLLMMPNQPTSDIIKSSPQSTTIVNDFTLSQLATFLPAELCYSKMRKLYVGKDSGFSMRSFESKVMKWNAPTILFVSGSRINPLKKKLSKGAETFLSEEYPKFKPSAENDSYGTGSEKLTFGVYVHQPWKLSNKETFGDSKTLIFQLGPQQQLFQTSNFPSKKFVYFTTFDNGGIGFGCELPISKNGVKKYQPGNVSLLIDGGLEFCSFRHIGPGGSFQTGSGYMNEAPEYEDKFVISDLEVYGVGSDKEIQEQLKQWEWEKKEAEARQRVNLKNLGEERLFLEMAGLVGHNGSGGSV